MDKGSRLTVVGVGASAGGLDALSRMFGHVSPDMPIAFVVVQHLSPEHPSLMPELLSRRTRLQVELASDHVHLRPGVCYLMPPGAEVAVTAEDALLVRGSVQGSRFHHPIDTLFEALAAKKGDEAVGVVLSGTGTDGTRGAAAIREAGGTVLVQAPGTAQFDGMPLSALAVDEPSHICAPEEMAPALERLLAGRGIQSTDARVGLRNDLADRVLEATGFDIRNYKESTFQRRLHRRFEETGCPDEAAYYALLARTPDEASALVEDMLIDVTAFMRDIEGFAAMRDVHLPRLVRALPEGRDLRIWSAGCARGHEAYSIAMLAAEAVQNAGLSNGVKVFATDANREALRVGGLGIYPAAELENVPAALVKKYFVPVGNDSFQVVPSLRSKLVFAPHNLHADPPFTQVDIIVCRNVLIYFKPEIQHKILRMFHFSLRRGGVLFLGESESIGELRHLFEGLGKPGLRLYRREDATDSLRGINPLAPRAMTRPKTRAASAWGELDRARETLLQTFAPAAALIDKNDCIQYVFGDLSRYLTIRPGELSQRVDQMLRSPLPSIAVALLSRVRQSKEPANFGAVVVGTEGEDACLVELQAFPVRGSSSVLLCFREQSQNDVALGPSVLDTEHLDGVNRELIYTRESLQETIEELHTANEEMQASNEEMLASNEELQATNEELQATNEELYTVSAERQEQINELNQVREDMELLFLGLRQGAVFLDEDLRIRRVSGSVSPYIRVTPDDVGRELIDFSHVLEDVDLNVMARQVLRTGDTAQCTVMSASDFRSIRVSCQRYQSRFDTQGVVVNLVDVTKQTAAEGMIQRLLDGIPQSVALMDACGDITHTNRAWRAFAARSGGGEHVGVNYVDVVRADGDARDILSGLEAVLGGRQTTFQTDYVCATPEEDLVFLMDVSPLSALRTPGVPCFFVSHTDVTRTVERKQAEQVASDRFDVIFEASSGPLLVLDAVTRQVERCNTAAEDLFQRSQQVLCGAPLEMLVPRDAFSAWTSALARCRQHGGSERILEVLLASGDDQPCMARLVHLPAAAHETSAHVLVQLSTQEAHATRMTNSSRLEALGNLAGGVAHEMNNVLAAVLGIVETWKHDRELPEEMQLDIEDVVNACVRGRDVTRNLLGFARTKAVVSSVPVGDSMREAARIVRLDARARQITVDVQVDDDVRLSGDKSMFVQALVNLCKNGIDAIEQAERGTAGRLVLRARVDENGDVVVSVEDNGIGMSDVTKAQVVAPFFSTKEAGTGLGFPMVYGVARALGGHIEIQSRYGVGTTVELVLPVPPRAENEDVRRAEEPVHAVHAGRALLVEDDPLVRRTYARMLSSLGWTVETAENGEDALDRLEASSVDVVITDVMMPRMNGVELLRAIRATRPELPVFLCSGFPQNEAADAPELDEPHTHFLYKPVRKPDLARMLRAVGRADAQHARV